MLRKILHWSQQSAARLVEISWSLPALCHSKKSNGFRAWQLDLVSELARLKGLVVDLLPATVLPFAIVSCFPNNLMFILLLALTCAIHACVVLTPVKRFPQESAVSTAENSAAHSARQMPLWLTDRLKLCALTAKQLYKCSQPFFMNARTDIFVSLTHDCVSKSSYYVLYPASHVLLYLLSCLSGVQRSADRLTAQVAPL